MTARQRFGLFVMLALTFVPAYISLLVQLDPPFAPVLLTKTPVVGFLLGSPFVFAGLALLFLLDDTAKKGDE